MDTCEQHQDLLCDDDDDDDESVWLSEEQVSRQQKSFQNPVAEHLVESWQTAGGWGAPGSDTDLNSKSNLGESVSGLTF